MRRWSAGAKAGLKYLLNAENQDGAHIIMAPIEWTNNTCRVLGSGLRVPSSRATDTSDCSAGKSGPSVNGYKLLQTAGWPGLERRAESSSDNCCHCCVRKMNLEKSPKKGSHIWEDTVYMSRTRSHRTTAHYTFTSRQLSLSWLAPGWSHRAPSAYCLLSAVWCFDSSQQPGAGSRLIGSYPKPI